MYLRYAHVESLSKVVTSRTSRLNSILSAFSNKNSVSTCIGQRCNLSHTPIIHLHRLQSSSSDRLSKIKIQEVKQFHPPPQFGPRYQRNSSTTTVTADSEHENKTSSSSTVPALVPPEHLNAAEKKIYHHLVQQLEPTSLDVQDISGGCGSTYAIEIVSHLFTGLTLVQQQKLVYVALRDMIKDWHGVRIQTSPP